ncbi:MAG: Dimethylallyltranstransferase [Bacteroidota bacterium]|jgi:geranylgeranyl diphosphate synthase type II
MQKEFIAALDKEVNSLELNAQPIELYEPIRYLMALGGKRMRPVFALMAYSLFKSDWQRVLKPSLSIEIFHNFTLMHDDIMDKAPLRRGKQTVHEKWNDNIAILSGDVMLVKAYDYLNTVEGISLPDFQYLLKRFNQTAAEVCEGQQYDMNFESRDDVSLSEYIEMIRLKTSVLVGFSLEMGALLACESKEVASKLYQIGELVGLGFQLKDDILDVYGNPETFGKQPGGDILANKKTYLLISALQQAEGSLQDELQYWLQSNPHNPVEKIQTVTAIYNALGIKELAENKVKSYFDEALSGINQLNIPLQGKNQLTDFLSALMVREV